MPELRSPKQERYCYHRARGLSQASAYVAAGYADNANNASVLDNKPHIIRRVAALMKEREHRATHQAMETIDLARKAETFDDLGCSQMQLLAQAKALYDIAITENDVKSGIKVLEFMGKISGFLNLGGNRGADNAAKVPASSDELARKTIDRQMEKAMKHLEPDGKPEFVDIDIDIDDEKEDD